MPHFYLGNLVWRTAPRPSWGMPPGMAAMVDLRPLPAIRTRGGSPQGWAFFVAHERLADETGFDYLGADPSRRLTNPQRNAWRSRLGLLATPSRSVLREVLYETLTSLADPAGDDVAPPLVPNRRGELVFSLAGIRRRLRPGEPEFAAVQDRLRRNYRKIREEALAGRAPPNQHRKYLAVLLRKFGLTAADARTFIPADLPVEGPETPATERSDNFNRADSSTLGTSAEGWSWTEVFNESEIFSNTAANTTAGDDCVARAEADLSSDDQVVQADAVAFNNFTGVAARFNPSARDYYAHFVVGFNAQSSLWKSVAGTYTQLTSDVSVTLSAPNTIRIDVDGSTISSLFNGAAVDATTDTSVTGYLRAGFDILGNAATDCRIDNWSAADLAADNPRVPRPRIITPPFPAWVVNT